MKTAENIVVWAIVLAVLSGIGTIILVIATGNAYFFLCLLAIAPFLMLFLGIAQIIENGCKTSDCLRALCKDKGLLWTCKCGEVNAGDICTDKSCGYSKNMTLSDETWTCSCGIINTGNVCRSNNCVISKEFALKNK